MAGDRQDGGDRPRSEMQTLLSAVPFLGFGLMLLALLVAIDRQSWFELRPASGTAAAMFYAADGSRATK